MPDILPADKKKPSAKALARQDRVDAAQARIAAADLAKAQHEARAFAQAQREADAQVQQREIEAAAIRARWKAEDHAAIAGWRGELSRLDGRNRTVALHSLQARKAGGDGSAKPTGDDA